jgi:hypothetical protein
VRAQTAPIVASLRPADAQRVPREFEARSTLGVGPLSACMPGVDSHRTTSCTPSGRDPFTARRLFPPSLTPSALGMDVPELLKRAQDMLVSPTSQPKAASKAKQHDVGVHPGHSTRQLAMVPPTSSISVCVCRPRMR